MASDGEVAVGGRIDCAEKSRLLRGNKVPAQEYSRSTIKKDGLILVVVAFTACLGCNHDPGSFQGHSLGDSLAQFCAIEHPKIEIPPGVLYTGTIHCFDEENLGDQCKGPRKDFDNAHFTFVDDKLARIETVGLGGIIGNSRQNWNWNLYLSALRRQYGKPDRHGSRLDAWQLRCTCVSDRRPASLHKRGGANGAHRGGES